MPSNNSKSAREYRRKGAEERQAVYSKLSTEEKLALTATRPGNSFAERARLAQK